MSKPQKGDDMWTATADSDRDAEGYSGPGHAWRVDGQAAGGAVLTVNAAASVFAPSAAPRPSRLSAVAQMAEYDADFDGDPDRPAFPLQATVGSSAWVGSVALNAALHDNRSFGTALRCCFLIRRTSSTSEISKSAE
jgi:hypothetical protein